MTAAGTALLGLAGMLAVTATGCGHQTRAATASPVSYTCCRAADIHSPRHPGQTMTLHWLVKGAPTPSPPSVTLRAALAGPYATVAALKADKQPKYTIAAPAVHPSGALEGAPTSALTIPAAARAGYYNLRFTTDGAGTSTSGSSVVRVW